MDEWWNGDGTGGWNENANPLLRECWTFFIYIFLHLAENSMSRICASKTERNLQIFGLCLQFKQSCPWATLSYFCLQNKAGKINAMRRVVLRKMFQKSSALSIHFEMRRSPFAIEFTTFAAKKPQAYNAQYNTQGRGVWEESRRGAAPLHRL